MGSQEGNPKIWVALLVQLAWQAGACHGELLNATPMFLGVPGSWGSFQTSPNASFDVFVCCSHLKTYWNIKWIGFRLIL